MLTRRPLSIGHSSLFRGFPTESFVANFVANFVENGRKSTKFATKEPNSPLVGQALRRGCPTESFVESFVENARDSTKDSTKFSTKNSVEQALVCSPAFRLPRNNWGGGPNPGRQTPLVIG